MRDRYHIIPMFSATLLHAGFVASLLFAFDWSSTNRPQVPLAIKGTVITDMEDLRPPRRDPEPVIEPEPEPEPEPEVDLAEQERLRVEAEETKRLEDLRVERERVAREEEAERRRRADAEAERKRREEADRERREAEAERRRQAEIDRQRLENEQRRREAEEAELARRRQQEIEDEEARLAAMNADDETVYAFMIQRHVGNNVTLPASAPGDLECIVNVRQDITGRVLSVELGRCNGDDAVRRAIMAGVERASPLPLPDNPRVFQRDLQITFKPEQ